MSWVNGQESLHSHLVGQKYWGGLLIKRTCKPVNMGDTMRTLCSFNVTL